MERGEASNFPIQKLPGEMVSKILSHVAEGCTNDLGNSVLASDVLATCADDYQVFQKMELTDLIRSPLRAVNKHQDLMKKFLTWDNPSAHYIRGLLEYFHNNNTNQGLNHLQTAANATTPIPEAVYLFGVINLCLGNIEIGKTYMDRLRSGTDHTKGDACWKNIKRSLHGIGMPPKPEYMESLMAMTPPYVCNLNDMETTCDTCYHFKQMVKFVYTI